MRVKTIGARVLVAGWMAMACGSVWGQSLPVSGDTFVAPGTAANYSTSPTVNVGGAGDYQGLISFDLSALPAGTTSANVSKASITFFVNKVGAPGAIDVYAASGSWSEGAVTGMNAPVPGMVGASFVELCHDRRDFAGEGVAGWDDNELGNPDCGGRERTGDFGAVRLEGELVDESSSHPAGRLGGFGGTRPSRPAGSLRAAGFVWTCRATGCCRTGRSIRDVVLPALRFSLFQLQPDTDPRRALPDDFNHLYGSKQRNGSPLRTRALLVIQRYRQPEFSDIHCGGNVTVSGSLRPSGLGGRQPVRPGRGECPGVGTRQRAFGPHEPGPAGIFDRKLHQCDQRSFVHGVAVRLSRGLSADCHELHSWL
jgi:hypothetical protein